MSQGEELGIIGQTEVDGLPVIYKLVDELPAEQVRTKFTWLTVVAWEYDRAVRNGMPPEATNEQMLSLEQAIDALEETGLCRHAYSRTGNGLKELVYYISDQDTFMGALNEALSDHPRYPLEISFYEDAEWKDFQEVRNLFTKR